MLNIETADIGRYLAPTDIIDFDHGLVGTAAQKLMPDSDECTFTERAYKYVRDSFPHSFDLYKSGRPVYQVSCRASDVIANGHGPVRPEMGEEDGFIIYADPSPSVLAALKNAIDTADLFDNLPDKI
jgi:hypothetical protein